MGKARLVHNGADTFLEASSGAPGMTPDNVKQMLDNWP
jgi:hypothetical protein